MTEYIPPPEESEAATDSSDDLKNNTTRRSIETAYGRGDSNRALTNAYMGFNHRMSPNRLSKNLETPGLTFFTRPDLNFNEDNMRSSRRFNKMMENPLASDAYGIIAALDPESPLTLRKDVSGLGAPLREGIPFDNRQAFIPFLSNTLISLSGWPDNALDIYTSEEGIQKEQWSMVDSTYEINNTYSLSAAFRNVEGDPITTLFTTWLEWMAGSYDGTFIPKARSIIQREIEYQTRIYRLVLDPTMRFVTKIGACFAAFPLNDNLGAAINFSGSDFINTETDNINIQFHAIGARYQDPALVEDFNYVVGMFNPDMLPLIASDDEYLPRGKDYMRLLTREEIIVFNYYGYPRINPITMELQWWVYSDDYESVMSEI